MTSRACLKRIGSVALVGMTVLTSCQRRDRSLLVVSDEVGGALAIVDPDRATVEARITVGKRPRGVRLSRDGHKAFVALSGSSIAGPGVDEAALPPGDRSADGIGVVDLAARKLVRTYQSGQDPESFDLSRDGRRLYVSNEETAEMSVLDLESGRVIQRVPIGEEPEGVTVSPDGRTVFVTCEGANEIVGIDTTSHAIVARVPTGPRPRALVFTPDGATLFVSAENGASLTVADARAGRASATIDLPRTGTTPPRPMGLALSPDGTRLFVSNGRARSVSVIDVHTNRVLQTIEEAGARPWGIGVSADGRSIYTANGPGGDVSVIDIGGRVLRRIRVGGSPWGLAVWSPQASASTP